MDAHLITQDNNMMQVWALANVYNNIAMWLKSAYKQSLFICANTTVAMLFDMDF